MARETRCEHKWNELFKTLGRPGYRLTLAGLAWSRPAEWHHSSQVTPTQDIYWPELMRKRKSAELQRFPGTGKPCSAQRPGSLSSSSTTVRSTSTASGCRGAARSAGRTWAPGGWRKHPSASLSRLPMAIGKSAACSSGRLKGRFSGTVFDVLPWTLPGFPLLLWSLRLSLSNMYSTVWDPVGHLSSALELNAKM